MRNLLKAAAWTAIAFAAFLISDSPVLAGGPLSPPSGTYNWSGFYIGGHVGGGWENTSFTDASSFAILNNCCVFVNDANEPGAAASSTTSSFLGGGQAGWMYQFDHLVIGGDVDFSAMNIQQNGVRSFPRLGTVFVNESYSAHTDWTATSTMTFGYAAGPWLFYGKAGAAWEHETYGLGIAGFDSAPFTFTAANSSKIITGWTGGAGVKWAITDNLFLFGEYDYLNFGLNAEPTTGTLSATRAMFGAPEKTAIFSPTFNQNISEFKVGLNYKFGGGPAGSMSPFGFLPQWPGSSRTYDWSGPYVGAHVGGGLQHIGFADPSEMSVLFNCCLNLGEQGNPGGASAGNGGGFIGGVQTGWAYQLGHLVIGGDADFTATSIGANGSSTLPPLSGSGLRNATEAYNVQTNWTATATTTLGVANGPWLFYGKAGAAWADNSYGLNVSGAGGTFGGTPGIPFSSSTSASHVVLGWTTGVGLKYALSSNLFLNAEYDYLDFGSVAQHIPGTLGPLVGPGIPFGTPSSAVNFDPIFRQEISEFKVGLNYKFGSGGPMDTFIPQSWAAATYDWSGPYVGAHVGGGLQTTRFSDPGANSVLVACCVLSSTFNAPTGGSDANGLGALGGVQAGLMYQIDRLVVGVDTDFSGSTMNGTGASIATGTPTGRTFNYNEVYNVQTNWLGTSTATLGLATGRWLFYGKGGVAYADNTYNLNVNGRGNNFAPAVPFSYASSIDRMNVGWTTGVGMKWAFSDSLFLNAEYDLMDFGSTTHAFNGNFSATPASFGAFSKNATFEPMFNQTISAVKVGLNYKFQPF